MLTTSNLNTIHTSGIQTDSSPTSINIQRKNKKYMRSIIMVLLYISRPSSLIKQFYDYEIQKIVAIIFQAMPILFNFDPLTPLLFTIIMNHFFATRHIFLISKAVLYQYHSGSTYLFVIPNFTSPQKH